MMIDDDPPIPNPRKAFITQMRGGPETTMYQRQQPGRPSTGATDLPPSPSGGALPSSPSPSGGAASIDPNVQYNASGQLRPNYNIPAMAAQGSSPRIGLPGGPETSSRPNVTPGGGGGNFQNDFWQSVQGIDVHGARGHLDSVAQKLQGMGYADAKVTGEDTIFANGQEWDIVPSGDGSWQLIPDAGMGGGGGQGSMGLDPQMAGAYRDQLLKLMQGMDQPLDLNAPGIAEPYNAAKLASDRELEQGRKDDAERLFAEGGLNSRELGMDTQQSHERAASGLAHVRGNLVQHEQDARRQSLMHALDLADALGARNEANAIRMRLAQMQQSQWDDSYGLNRAELESRTNRQSYLDLMG